MFCQVQKLGCVAFALLFDDIDPQLHGADVDAFSSFGDAQVEVTNNVYKHLGCPSFLFCPTGNFSHVTSITSGFCKIPSLTACLLKLVKSSTLFTFVLYNFP